MTTSTQRLVLTPAALVLAFTGLVGCGGNDPAPTSKVDEPAATATTETTPAAPSTTPSASPTTDIATIMTGLKSDVKKVRAAIEAGQDPHAESMPGGSIKLSKGTVVALFDQTSPSDYRLCITHLRTTAWARYDNTLDKVTMGESGGCNV